QPAPPFVLFSQSGVLQLPFIVSFATAVPCSVADMTNVARGIGPGRRLAPKCFEIGLIACVCTMALPLHLLGSSADSEIFHDRSGRSAQSACANSRSAVAGAAGGADWRHHRRAAHGA